jgi:hypothetical protein
VSALWYPDAIRVPQLDNGAFTGGPPKTLLHSTESHFGKGWATFRPGTHPHFEVTALPATRTVAVKQFYPIDQPSRSLADGPLAVRTNRDGVIQVELGYQAANAAEVPDWFWEGVVPLLRWIEDNAGVDPNVWAEFRAYPLVLKRPVRFTAAQWDRFGGTCGHQHCPDGNSHGDPGAVPVDLLKRPRHGRPPTLRRFGRRYPYWTRRLQRALGLRATGTYGPHTAATVRAYKRRHKIRPATSTAGRRVWRSLGIH